jgi:hypothetical protein
MMQYDGDLLLPKTYLVPPPEIKGVSGEYLVKNNINTFACSEVRAGCRGPRAHKRQQALGQGLWALCEP